MRLLTLLFLCIAVVGCVDPIDLDVGEHESRLVVDAEIKEGSGPHLVVLSRTGAFTQGLNAIRPAERGATVTVERASGGVFTLSEVQNGRYQSFFPAQVGETYTLNVVLADGTTYRSAPETMRATPGMSAVSAELQPYTELISGTPVQRHRVNFFVAANRTPNQTDYYRWSWSGTYAIQACYIQDGREFCDTCYRPLSENNRSMVGTDITGTGSVLPRQRAGEVRLEERVRLPSGPQRLPIMSGRAFGQAFMVTIQQESLTAETYNYWDGVRRFREDVGSLFDPPAENLPSNITRVGDPTDVTLGYFTVSGATRKSDCFRRSDFPGFPTLGQPESIAGRCHTLGGSVFPPPGWFDTCGS
jgi:hypothetical protein